MSDKSLNIIVKLIAPLFLIIGLGIGFIDLENKGLILKNDGYVTAAFSMTAVLLYFAALMYQIKEYKLQIEELKKSVEAQIISSKALQEQKEILLEQSFTSLIFNLISDFKQFKKEHNIKFLLEQNSIRLGEYIVSTWHELSNEKRTTKEELNKRFASEIKCNFVKIIRSPHDLETLRQYVQFAFNILGIIDENKLHFKKDYLTSTFYIQITKEEELFLALADVVDFDMPHFGKFDWKYYTTEKLINLTKDYKNIDFSEIDAHALTDAFIKLKKLS